MKTLLALTLLLVSLLSAFAADTKVSDLQAITSPSDASLLLVTDPGASPQSRKYLLTNLVKYTSLDLKANLSDLLWTNSAGTVKPTSSATNYSIGTVNGNGQTLSGETGSIYAFGSGLGDSQNLTDSQYVFNIGFSSGNNQIGNGARDIFNIGDNAGSNQDIGDGLDVFNFGESAGYSQILRGATAGIYNIGEKAGEAQSINAGDTVYNIGNKVGYSQIVDNSFDIYNLFNYAGWQQKLTNSFDIYNIGNSAGIDQVLNDSNDIWAIGNNTGTNLVGTFNHIFQIGSGAKATNSNDFVFGDSAYNYKFPGASFALASPITFPDGTIQSTAAAGGGGPVQPTVPVSVSYSSSLSIDFQSVWSVTNAPGWLVLGGSTTISSSNLAAGYGVFVYVDNTQITNCNVILPSGWRKVSGAATNILAPGNIGILTAFSRSANDTNVICTWSSE